MFTCIVVSRVHLLYTQELGLLDSQYTPGLLVPRIIYSGVGIIRFSVCYWTPSTQNNILRSWDYQILSILLDSSHLEQYTLELGLLDSQYTLGHLAPRTIYSGVGIIRFSVYSWTPRTQNNIIWSWGYQILGIILDTQHLEQYTQELGLLDSQYTTGLLVPGILVNFF